MVRDCVCRKSGNTYAVKIFRSEDEEMYIHAEREFKIIEKLHGHPNIVEGVEYIGELLRSRGYIVMEKISGKSIFNTVQEKGPLSEEESKGYLRQMLEAVKYMHTRGVVHRDMNPTNVFLL